MVNKPDILFADEPCANLDTENSRMVLDLFQEINEEMQQTIVMVSHEDWHKEYFHRIIRLKDGKVVSDGTEPGSTLGRRLQHPPSFFLPAADSTPE